MTKQDLDTQITNYIHNAADVGMNSTELREAVGLSKRTAENDRLMDNALKRLKTKGVISFDKGSKMWKTLQTKASVPADDGVVESAPQLGQADDAPATQPTQESNMDSSTTNSTESIDEAISRARSASSNKAPKGPDAPKRVKLTDEQKAIRDEQRSLDQKTKREEREAIRAQKKSQRDQERKPAHMSKVEKAATRLPSLESPASDMFQDVITNLPQAQIAALAAHLQHYNRTKATELALTQQVKNSDTVEIIGGEPRFIGKTGIVTKAQRIRCYVEVEGVNKPIYLFTSDVKVISSEPAKIAVNA